MPSWTDFDHRMMERAIALARRGEGFVEPNPMVGCVIVRRGRVIGEGFHRRFGGPHAEVNALRDCRISPRGATVYVSLEPCCHFGKTPACTAALIKSEIERVVVSVRDPNPRVAGRGLAVLRRAGISVATGLLAEEAKQVLRPFRTCIEQRRPYVIAKWAQSLDGKLAARRGQSKWISGVESRRCVHRLRARVDAILVGSGTVFRDDPRLTARDVRIRRVALRAVLDGRLRIPLRCRLVVTARQIPTMVFARRAASRSAKAKRLRRAGVEVIAVDSVGGRLSLAQCAAVLLDRGVTNLLVEGGPTVLSGFLQAGLVDEAWVFVAPMLMGGDGPAVLVESGATRLRDPLRPHRAERHSSGEDTLHVLRFAPA